MDFCEKLNFLIRISNVSGTELAEATHVVKSTISLYRSGRRGMPRNRQTLQSFADYFASKLRSDYQMQALAEFTGNELLISSREDFVVAGQLMNWFEEGRSAGPKAGELMIDPLTGSLSPAERRQNSIPADPSRKALGADSSVTSRVTAEAGRSDELLSTESRLFFGSAGKAEAVRLVLRYLKDKGTPGTIYLSIDDDQEWISRDTALYHELEASLQELIGKGFTFIQILPPSSAPHFYDTLRLWSHLYITQRVTPYYYPRMRDNVFRGIFIALEGEIAVSSQGLMGNAETGYTLVSVQAEVVSHTLNLLKEMVRFCIPAIRVTHTDRIDTICRELYVNSEDDILSMRSYLPLELAPQGLYKQIDHSLHKEDRSIINLVSLPSVSHVAEGKIKRVDPALSPAQWEAHTPASYAEHLETILSWLDDSETHHLIPMTYTFTDYKSLVVCRDHHAYLIFADRSYTIYEVTEPGLVKFCEEFLLRKLDSVPYTGVGRIRIRKELEARIRELRSL